LFHRRARHMIVRLREELHKKEEHVKQLEMECKKEMIAKFGRVVDMDELCACIINLDILDALLVLESRRNRHYVERDQLAKRIEETRWNLTDVTMVGKQCQYQCQHIFISYILVRSILLMRYVLDP
jgi:hypothetical protein